MKVSTCRIGLSQTVSVLVAGLMSVSIGASAQADFGGPIVTLDWYWTGGSPGTNKYILHEDSHSQSNSGDAWLFEGKGVHSAWDMEWNVAASDSPGAQASGHSQFVNANLAVTNNSASYQTFVAIVTLALPVQFTGGTLMNGSVSASVQDVFGGGAEIRTANGEPVYQAFIDGGPLPVQTLLDPNFSLVANPGGTASDSATFGIPNPVPGPDALATISVQLTFELSPFDTANVVGTFEIAQAVPAPAALPLLGGFALIGSRRRRR